MIEVTTLVKTALSQQWMDEGRKSYKKNLTITIPGMTVNDEVEIAITKCVDVSTVTRISGPSEIPVLTTPLTLEELNQGEWVKRQGTWQYSVEIAVEAERDIFNVEIVVPAGDSEIKYIAKGSDGPLDVMVQGQETNSNSSNLYTSRVG